MNDPIVDEVRAIRSQIAEACDYDIKRILEHARLATQAIPGLRYVTLDELRRRRVQRERIDATQADDRPV